MMMRILDLPLPNPQIVKILALHVGQGFYYCLRGYRAIVGNPLFCDCSAGVEETRAIVGNPLFSYICSLSCLVLFLLVGRRLTIAYYLIPRFSPLPSFPSFPILDWGIAIEISSGLFCCVMREIDTIGDIMPPLSVMVHITVFEVI